MIRKQLHQLEISPKKTPLLKEKDVRQAKNLVDIRQNTKNEEIRTEIKLVNFEENETSVEIFKQIWLALELNEELTILIEDPDILIERQEQKEAGDEDAEAGDSAPQ